MFAMFAAKYEKGQGGVLLKRSHAVLLLIERSKRDPYTKIERNEQIEEKNSHTVACRIHDNRGKRLYSASSNTAAICRGAI